MQLRRFQSVVVLPSHPFRSNWRANLTLIACRSSYNPCDQKFFITESENSPARFLIHVKLLSSLETDTGTQMIGLVVQFWSACLQGGATMCHMHSHSCLRLAATTRAFVLKIFRSPNMPPHPKKIPPTTPTTIPFQSQPVAQLSVRYTWQCIAPVLQEH